MWHTKTYKLASAARPGRYVSLDDGKIVGHSDGPGVMTEWFATFHEGGMATFQAVRNGKVCDEYIYFNPNTLSLTCSDNPWLFLIRESNSSEFFSIEIECTDDWAWTLTSWDENSPIETKSNTGSTQQLWKFESSSKKYIVS